MTINSRGLLFVYSERGPSISADTFDDWYDNEHIPLLLNLPGPLFHNCTRWIAADEKTPTHLTLYDLSSPNAILEPASIALATSRSERELDILRKVEYLDRRVYVPVEQVSAAKDGYDEHAPGPHLSALEIIVEGEEAEEEIAKWYAEEHVPMLSKVPGWARTRLFVWKSTLGVSGTSVDESAPRQHPGKYLTLHEWTSLDAFNTEEFKKAISTPWSVRMLGKEAGTKFEMRMFKFLKGYESAATANA